MGDNINGITRILELFHATFVINVLRNDMDIEVLWMLKMSQIIKEHGFHAARFKT